MTFPFSSVCLFFYDQNAVQRQNIVQSQNCVSHLFKTPICRFGKINAEDVLYKKL